MLNLESKGITVFSKLLYALVKVITRTCQSCYMYLSKLFQSPTTLLAKPKQAKVLGILKLIVIEPSATSFELKWLWLLKMPTLKLPKVVLVANIDKIVCDDET